ncbi:hypothetical protein [Pendulispora albinea]|uniref:Uncharacterized protein n=1 Tax=Pendulispora albinea TaxID=2741071 RepID=A0ABZ2LMT7_9BACT
MSARTKRPRAVRPEEQPLDDGGRYGTETWRDVDGVVFCHWDRWLLRLALTEPNGLDSIAAEFRARGRNPRTRGDDHEAMLAQVTDLKARLARVNRRPEDLLDDQERASAWLQKKAFKRVWHDGPNRRTEAMCKTPRRLLAARAMRGNWSCFSVSPARYEPELRNVVGTSEYFDHRWTGTIATVLESKIEILAMMTSDAERLALYRAALTVIIETMERIDDSLAEMSDVFANVERSYLELAGDALDKDGVLRDLLELAVWEDYGLFCRIEDFLRTLREQYAGAAMREIAAMIAELRREELDYPLRKALALHRVLLAS